MLVLSRKLGEKILIDGGIVLTVVDIDRGKIRLGIEAPKGTKIFREELVRTTLPSGEIKPKSTDLPNPKEGGV